MISKLTKKTIFPTLLLLSLSMLIHPQVFAEDNPSYSDHTLFTSRIVEKEHPRLFNDNSLLSIPRVDSLEQDGLYQNVTLVFDQSVDAWRLLYIDTYSPIDDLLVEQVELSVIESSPTQVILFLKVNEAYSSCRRFRSDDYNISQKLIDNSSFEVTLNTSIDLSEKDECVENAPDVVLALPLQVLGLDVGTYEYVVNNTHTGTFDLNDINMVFPPSLSVK